MERECCLSMLIILMGGTTLLACGCWPAARVRGSSALRLEEITWRRVWLPVAPGLAVAAWLCGWALTEPDPVPERVPISLVLAAAPFALLLARAAVRAGWSLIVDQGDPATATVGLLRPWIVFSPHLARRLDEGQVDAVLEHERAHARHWDPLRIWLAQLATDLQWPWPQARYRFSQWMLVLELARDEEARVVGSDLAAATMASARFRHNVIPLSSAALTGEPSALKERFARLLGPLQDYSEETTPNDTPGCLGTCDQPSFVSRARFSVRRKNRPRACYELWRNRQTGAASVPSQRHFRMAVLNWSPIYSIALLALVFFGCATYRPEPLESETIAQQFNSRSLSNSGLCEYLKANLGTQLSSCPPEKWEIGSLTLVGFYYSPDLAVGTA